MSCEIHLNDIGTLFKLTIKDCSGAIVDISTATSNIIKFKNPSGDTIAKTGSFFTDGTDAISTYTTVDGDLNEIGTWKVQAKVTLPTGTWNSTIETFKVYDNL